MREMRSPCAATEHAALQARAARDRREVTIAIDPPSLRGDAGGGCGGGPELEQITVPTRELRYRLLRGGWAGSRAHCHGARRESR